MALGQILGGIVGGAIGFIVGGPFGAFVGFSIGSSIGGIFSSPKSQTSGPANQGVMAAQYGTVIPIVFGEPKAITGNCIFYDNFQADKHKVKQKTLFGSKTVGEYYTYSVSVAFGLSMTKCSLVQILVNGVDYPLGTNGQLFYDGTQTAPNNHIQDLLTAKGRTRFPVWKGLCYAVLPNDNTA